MKSMRFENSNENNFPKSQRWGGKLEIYGFDEMVFLFMGHVVDFEFGGDWNRIVSKAFDKKMGQKQGTSM